MKKILLFIIIISTMVSCNTYERLEVPISNHTYSEFYVEISSSLLRKSQIFFVNKRAFSQRFFTLKNKGYEEKIYFGVKIIEKDTKNIISQKNLGFPGEGVMSASAKGGLCFVIDIFQSEDNYNVIYSLDTFIYGLPYSKEERESNKR